jgi:hypothetical protein
MEPSGRTVRAALLVEDLDPHVVFPHRLEVAAGGHVVVDAHVPQQHLGTGALVDGGGGLGQLALVDRRPARA